MPNSKPYNTMYTLIYVLLISLSLFAMGFAQSNYASIAYSISERWRANRSIGNVLNWLSRNFDDIAEEKIKPKIEAEHKSKSRQENAKKRLEGHAILRMVKLLLGNEFAPMIELWNPKDERKKRLLGERHLERLEVGEETDYKKGGISPFTLTQYAYSIGKEYMKRHGTTWKENDGVTLDQIDLNAYRKGEANEATKKFVGILFDIADEYNAPKDEEWKEKQSEEEASTEESAETEEVAGTVTVEDYLNGNVKLSDIDSEELLQEFRSDDRITGGKKGAVSRRINELT